MGVRSNTRAILKMQNCTFTYPGKSKPSLLDVSCALSLSSRVGIVGPNGAGKSTLIKLLTVSHYEPYQRVISDSVSSFILGRDRAATRCRHEASCLACWLRLSARYSPRRYVTTYLSCLTSGLTSVIRPPPGEDAHPVYSMALPGWSRSRDPRKGHPRRD